jgi:hypothetical protein
MINTIWNYHVIKSDAEAFEYDEKPFIDRIVNLFSNSLYSPFALPLSISFTTLDLSSKDKKQFYLFLFFPTMFSLFSEFSTSLQLFFLV